MKRVLKALPKWVILAFVALLFVVIAGNIVRHYSVKSRVNEQKERIHQQQQFIREKRKELLPDVPDIWD